MTRLFAHVLACPQQAEEEGMDMPRIAYVASKAANAAHALDPEYVIDVCAYGPSLQLDAESYAKDETKSNDTTTYVYRVEIEPVRKFEIHKEVVGSAHTLQG